MTTQTGTVKWFNEAKGYGFIAQDAGGADLFEREAETWVNLGLHPHGKVLAILGGSACQALAEIGLGGVAAPFASLAPRSSTRWPRRTRTMSSSSTSALTRSGAQQASV